MVAPDDGLVKSNMKELCSCGITCEFLSFKEKSKKPSVVFVIWLRKLKRLGSIHISYCVDQKKTNKQKKRHIVKNCVWWATRCPWI